MSPVSHKLSGFIHLAWTVATICCGSQGVLQAEGAEELPLPNWQTKEATPQEIKPVMTRAQLSPLLPEAPPEDRFDPFKLFIPRSLSVKPVEPAPPPVIKLHDVEAAVMTAAEQMPEESLLLDPQGLLPEIQADDVRRLLSNHASEAYITARVLLIKHDQMLAKDASLMGLASGVLTKKPTCLIVFPMGEPKRTRVFTSLEISRTTPVGYLAKMVGDCIRDSQQVSNDVEQLERFVTQLSIRLFWLERAFEFKTAPEPSTEVASAGSPLGKPDSASAPKGKSDAIATAPVDLLPEVIPAPPPTILPAGALEKWMTVSVKIAWGLAIAASVLIVGITVWRWRMRRIRQMVWLLPEIEHVERLGGSHCGGCGSAIKYG